MNKWLIEEIREEISKFLESNELELNLAEPLIDSAGGPKRKVQS